MLVISGNRDIARMFKYKKVTMPECPKHFGICSPPILVTNMVTFLQ